MNHLAAETPQELARLYLQLLHSRRMANEARRHLTEEPAALGSGARALLETIDFEQLGAEQAGRVSDMLVSLKPVCPGLLATIGEERLHTLVAEYCESEYFWQARGRVLCENFCLFAYGALAERGDGFAADVARLDGVIIGLEAAPFAESPWPDHVKLAHEAEECFVARFRVLDDQLDTPNASNVEALRDAGPSATVVRVVRAPAGGVLLGCESYQAEQEVGR
jgi:hypothetical protein